MQNRCHNFAKPSRAVLHIRPVGFYRLYYLDDFSGHIVRVREFTAENDEAAIGYSVEVRSLTPMELWGADRKIKHWDAFPPTEPE